MSDYSKSDLRDIERALDEIKRSLSGGAFTTGITDKLSRMTDTLERTVSRLDEISKKLDKRA
jgi:hypothetical protein